MPPFLQQVTDSQLQTLEGRLLSLSGLTANFLVLLAGSTLIATLGLFQNSPAVIIGAMIIAPLMRPLVALSLATLTGDAKLLARAVITLVVGTIAGVVISGAMALLFRSLELTPEMLARTHPTLLDLGVAIFAGAVGAYCQADEKLSDTLAGVAIAVALVPPLSVVGIGLAFGSFRVCIGAALLYATNLIGITIAGSLVFVLMGFTPLHQAKKGLAISAAVSIVLIVPLALSMRELVIENQISIKIKSILREKTLTFRGVQLREVQVERLRKPMVVVATVLAPEQPISLRQVALVHDFLARELDMPLEFKLRIISAQEMSSLDFVPDDGRQPESSADAPADVGGPKPDEQRQEQASDAVDGEDLRGDAKSSSKETAPYDQTVSPDGKDRQTGNQTAGSAAADGGEAGKPGSEHQ